MEKEQVLEIIENQIKGIDKRIQNQIDNPSLTPEQKLMLAIFGESNATLDENASYMSKKKIIYYNFLKAHLREEYDNLLENEYRKSYENATTKEEILKLLYTLEYPTVFVNQKKFDMKEEKKLIDETINFFDRRITFRISQVLKQQELKVPYIIIKNTQRLLKEALEQKSFIDDLRDAYLTVFINK